MNLPNKLTVGRMIAVPFFIAACDYVIIGEEFFAVSASISGDPKLSGSLYGQDMVKVIVIVSVVAAAVLASIPTLGPVVLKIAQTLPK